MIHDLDINAHELLARAAQGIQSPCLDQILNGSFVEHILCRHTGDKVFQRFKGPEGISFLCYRLHHRTSDALDGSQAVTDISAVNGEICLAFVDVRRQDLNIHLPAGIDIFCHFGRILDHGSHKRCHELHRIVVFQPRGLVCYDRICGSMGLIEGILCKIDHFIIYFVRSLLVNTVFYTSRHIICFISIHEDLALFLHHVALFLGHGTAQKVASSQCVSGQVTHDLHDLLLIDDTSVCRLQYRL